MVDTKWMATVLSMCLAGCSAPGSAEKTQASSRDAAPGGTARAPISAVGLDCRAFDGYTATLATLTVDCLGTIGPETYRVTASGLLEPNFERCELAGGALTEIRQLLSLQKRADRLPNVRECLAGAYADHAARLTEQGADECPTWRKLGEVNPITPAVIEAVSTQLTRSIERRPFGDLRGEVSTTERGIPDELELKNLYRVSWPQRTGAGAEAASAAAACAAGFAGFVLQTVDDTVLTDPPTWMYGGTFPNAAADPFLAPNFYHPMSFYGPLPGVQFGHYNRAHPCPGCPGEKCSYYAGIHKITRLQGECLDPADITSCVSYCGPPLP